MECMEGGNQASKIEVCIKLLYILDLSFRGLLFTQCRLNKKETRELSVFAYKRCSCSCFAIK